MDSLYKYCMKTEDELIGSDAEYLFIDNGSDVLAIAHVDTVAKDNHKYAVKGNVVTSIALDDRLGAWIIMELLPYFGVLPDVLLTRDEEIGRSTAQLFTTKKQYNWIFSFDRRGDDVVMYDYENSESIDLLREHGFAVGVGSFSDICYLTHLGVIGFNFGTCYYNEHTHACYADMSEVVAQVEKFVVFYNNNSNVYMEYDPQTMGYARYGKYSSFGTYGGWDDRDTSRYDWAGKCIICDIDMMAYEVSTMDCAICCYCADAIEAGGEIHGHYHPELDDDEFMDLLDEQFDHYMARDEEEEVKLSLLQRRNKRKK